jgi:Mg2+ and Co2+ transporter CorA
VISLFLYLAGLINIWIMIVFVVITLACILYLYIGKQ